MNAGRYMLYAAAMLAAVFSPTGALAVKTEHHVLHAVPPPGAVAIDGKLDDWDLSGQIECFPSFRMRDVYSAKAAAMYDKDFLYVAAVWRDPTPMRNFVDPDADGNGWKSDCLQLRVITDVTLHVDCWYAASAKRPVVKILYGTLNPGEQNVSKFAPFPKPNAIDEGAREAFAPGEDGQSYTQEIALPWKLITGRNAIVKETGKPYAAPRRYQAGDTFTLGLDFGWGGPDGRTAVRLRHADLIKEGAVTRGANVFWADDACWGTVKLEPNGRLNLPRPDRQAMADRDRQKTAGPIALEYTMPFDGFATLVVEDEQGLRVKNLVGMAPRTKGRRTDYWDGTGEDGKPASPGKYRWRGLFHKGIDPVYEMSFGSPAAVPWETADGTGGWLSDTSPPSIVAAGRDVMILAAERAQAGSSIICVDLDGRKKWGNRSFSAIRDVAADNRYVYVLTCPKDSPATLARLDLATGRPVPFATKTGPQPAVPLLWEGEKATRFPSITVVGEKVAVAIPELLGIRLFDKETGAISGGWRIQDPRCLTRDLSGASWAWVIHHASVRTVTKLAGQVESLAPGIPLRMDRPVDVAVDEGRGLLFAIDGRAQQVRVYNTNGIFLHTVGARGGRPAAGPWKPDGLLDPVSLAIDSRGQIWVAEGSDPGRVSVWNVDGRLLKEFICPLGGGAGAAADPDDKSRVFADGCEFDLDYATGQARIVTCGLGDVSGQFIKANGREYFMNKRGKLYLRTGDTLKSVAAMAWFPWSRAKEYSDYPIAFTVEWETNGEPSGHHGGVCGSSFLWMDLNEDGKAQDDETTAGSRCSRTQDWRYPLGVADRGQYWLDEQFNLYSCGYEIGFYYPPSMGPVVTRIPFKGWTPAGSPIWDVKNQEMVIGVMKSNSYDTRYTNPVKGFEVNLPNGQTLFQNGQTIVYLPAEGRIVVGPPLTCVRDDGTILWTYKDDWAGPTSVYWQTTIPIADRDDLLSGTLGCIGRATTKLGTVFAIPSSAGRMHLMTMDGLLVATLFRDHRVAELWPAEARRGTSLAGVAMDGAPKGGAWFGHFFQAGNSKEYYLIAGSTACNVIKLNGLDSLEAIPGGELVVRDPKASATPGKVAPPTGDGKLEEKVRAFDLDKAVGTSATLTPIKDAAGAAIRIQIKGKQEGPAGAEIPAAGGKCDLSNCRFVVAEVRNPGTSPVEVKLRLENANAASFVADGLGVDPRQGWTWTKVAIRRPADAVEVKMFGMAEYPWGRPYERLKAGADIEMNDRWLTNAYPWARPIEAADGPGIDPANVVKLSILVNNPKEDCTLEVRNIRAAGVAPSAQMLAAPSKFFPCIDEFGQYIHADWPGKTRDIADLRKQREVEARNLAADPGPAEWNMYGGWKNGPTLEATGSFYVTRYKGKWWLVDPEGKLFFSTGITCVSTRGCGRWEGSPRLGAETDETPIQDREAWFRNLPALRADFSECIAGGFSMKRSGYYGYGPLKACFDFPQANSMRKYGKSWATGSASITHRRLRSWGMNTIGIYSSPAIAYQEKTPYVLCIRVQPLPPTPPAGPRNSPRLDNGIFWDVFRDDFDGVDPWHHFGSVPSDGWCVGYVIEVEGRGEPALDLGGDDVAYALAALRQQYDPAVAKCAKTAFLADLKAKYETIEKLNAAWGTGHASWDALLAGRETPDAARAHDDLAAFHAKAIDAYFSKMLWGVRIFMKSKLYMGVLFERAGAPAVAAAAKYSDVLAFRLNRNSPAGFTLPAGIDKPILVGEFGFSALDRGMLAGDLPDQAARAAAYKKYMQAALRHPQIVGCHWSRYRDYPASGRARDEANYNAGFVDIADTPYAEMVQAAREIGKTMYRIRLEAK